MVKPNRPYEKIGLVLGILALILNFFVLIF